MHSVLMNTGESDRKTTLSRKFRRARRRAGLATMEVVLATGIMLPFAIALFFIGRKACGRFYEIVESLVTWPYL